MGQLKEFMVFGLWGERNYKLKIDDGRLIIVGENGCGKTTALRIMYYALAKKWGQLAKEDFERIKITIDNDSKEITREQIGKPEEYMLDTHSGIFDSLPFGIKNLYAGQDNVLIEDIIESLKHLDKRAIRGEYINEILDEFEQKLGAVSSPARDMSEWLNLNFKQPILYMPTYRRIEKESELLHSENRYRRTRRNRMQADNNRTREVSYLGMQDVDLAIRDLIFKIKDDYARTSAQLNLNCFKGILIQDFKNVTEIPEEYIAPECIDMIFESTTENGLMDIDKSQIKDKLIAVIDKKEEYDEYDKIVIYYYNMLIKRYENLKITEDKLEHFFYICNQYLSSKEFVYKPSSFSYSIYLKSGANNHKEIDIEQLSSGEKQIVALFSYVYLMMDEPCMVIIDEPELSLSVTWQEKILEDVVKSDLCETLIVATQSPFVYDNSLCKYAHAIEEFIVLE